MRNAIWILLLFALAVAVTLLARVDQGYVLVVFPPWRVEVSFVLAVGLAILIFFMGYTLLRILRIALMLPADLKAWRRRRKTVQAEEELSRAVAALLSSQPAHARQLAERVLAHHDCPLAWLVVAHASTAQGDTETARACLGKMQSDHGELIAARQHLQATLNQTSSPEMSHTTPDGGGGA